MSIKTEIITEKIQRPHTPLTHNNEIVCKLVVIKYEISKLLIIIVIN